MPMTSLISFRFFFRRSLCQPQIRFSGRGHHRLCSVGIAAVVPPAQHSAISSCSHEHIVISAKGRLAGIGTATNLDPVNLRPGMNAKDDAPHNGGKRTGPLVYCIPTGGSLRPNERPQLWNFRLAHLWLAANIWDLRTICWAHQKHSTSGSHRRLGQ